MAAAAVVLFPVALAIWIVTVPFDRNLVILHLFTCWWAALYVYVHPGWKLRIEGRSKLPWRGPAVLVANHQSMVDALVLFAMYRPFKPVSKAVVQWFPLIGWNMRLNRYITLKRGRRKSLARMGAACRYWLGRGMPVMIYPEGRRSRDGQIHEFQNGAFTLAVEEQCPVYPIVIRGTADALPLGSALLGLRASLFARVLDPIFPNNVAPPAAAVRSPSRVAELRDRVRETMRRELERLRAEQTAPVFESASSRQKAESSS